MKMAIKVLREALNEYKKLIEMFPSICQMPSLNGKYITKSDLLLEAMQLRMAIKILINYEKEKRNK